ncbi:MAG: hypothetical protein WA902_21435 [Thermosynechococcaceae cyanobacterium]
MENQISDIKKAFDAYAQTFNLLDPEKVVPFFHLPSMLMTSDQVAVMQKPEEVLGVFQKLMESLKHKDFDESKIISMNTHQLSDNQGIISGVAKRFNSQGAEIEHFGFTYTLRKTEEDWKIIAGVIHDPESITNHGGMELT